MLGSLSLGLELCFPEVDVVGENCKTKNLSTVSVQKQAAPVCASLMVFMCGGVSRGIPQCPVLDASSDYFLRLDQATFDACC